MVGTVHPSLCCVQQLWARQLLLDPAVTLLAVCCNARTRRVRLVCAADVQLCAWCLTADACKLDLVKDAADLKCWGTHSLQVGACVALHALSFSDCDVQWLL